MTETMKLYTEEQVAEMWGVSTFHIQELRRQGKLKALRLGSTKLVRYSEKNLSDFLESLAGEKPSRGLRSLRSLAAPSGPPAHFAAKRAEKLAVDAK
jgi:hypothetical protein